MLFVFLELCEEITSDSYCSGDIALLKVVQKFIHGLWSNLQLPREEFSVMLPGILVCSVRILTFVNILSSIFYFHFSESLVSGSCRVAGNAC